MPRIALVYRSDQAFEHAWSGIPAGLSRGLAELRVQTTPVNANHHPALGRLTRGPRTREAALLRSIAVKARLRRTGPFHGAVQMGSDFGSPSPRPFVTLEDMTVAQAVRIPASEYSRLPEKVVAPWQAMQGRIYHRARACLVACDWARRSIVEDYGVDPQRVRVVGWGRNCDPSLRDRDWSSPRFLFVGLAWERKNGPAVLEAFERLRRERPDARLDLVGGHPPVATEGVTAHGRLDFSTAAGKKELEALYERATCLVLPSRLEPFAIAHLEAAAAGIPSIGTTVGGVRESIGAEGGEVVDPGDPDELLAAMRRLSDPDRARRAGLAVSERAPLYTWRAVAERVLRALEVPAPGDAHLADFL